MERKLWWNLKSELPEGDVYVAIVAIKELNKNYNIQTKMGMNPSEYNKYVIPACYIFNDEKWMSNGIDVTDIIQFWCEPEYP
jgi:hypothetical protein